VFWLCRRSATDPRFPRYPRLPMRRCAGYESQMEARDWAEERDLPPVDADGERPNQVGHAVSPAYPERARLAPETTMRPQEVEPCP
jgi:hypothetical protein